jgi:RNA polymerase sigma-70 factor, ECF subfamily
MIEELYDMHAGSLRRFALSMTRDDGEAEDLVHETFFRALSNMELLKILNPQKRRAWLFSVLRNCRIDCIRKNKFETLTDEEPDPPTEEPSDAAVDVSRLTRKLPRIYQDVVFKHYWLGMTSSEIGQSMGIPAATVRFRLHTALRLLKSKFHKYKGDM